MSNREIYVFITILFVVVIVLSVVGYQESISKDDEDKGEYVYKSPKEAIKDVDSKSLIKEVEKKGYFVYKDPKHVLKDIDEELLVDELRFKRRSHFYKTDRE